MGQCLCLVHPPRRTGPHSLLCGVGMEVRQVSHGTKRYVRWSIDYGDRVLHCFRGRNEFLLAPQFLRKLYSSFI